MRGPRWQQVLTEALESLALTADHVLSLGSQPSKRLGVPSPDERFAAIFKEVRVIAEVTEEQHLELIRLMKRTRARGRREVVAVLASDACFAAGMREADLGMSSGSAAPNTVRRQCEVEIQHGLVPTLVQAIRWGRGFFDASQRLLQYRAVASLATLGLTLVGSLQCARMLNTRGVSSFND